MNNMKWTLRFIKFICIASMLSMVVSCGQSESNESDDATIRVTFHDTSIDGSTIQKINLTILETQIIDIFDNKTIISSEPQSFNLLDLTANNPVVLAHTRISPGTYKQIRLILDSNSSLTFTDGSTSPLKVPSGEMTGLKIDGIFEIPPKLLYTLDIDLDPGQSVHFSPGTGYLLKPVVVLSGSQINSGNFFYSGSFGEDKFVIKMATNNAIEAKVARYPKYIITGDYSHDGLKQTLTVTPEEIKCPSCSWWEKKKLKWFGDVPSASTYDVVSFGADNIDLRNQITGDLMHLYRVPSFSLEFSPPTKDFALRIADLQFAWEGTSQYDEPVLFGQLIPENHEGRGFAAISTLSPGEDTYLEYSIPAEEFQGLPEKSYILTLGVVGSVDGLTLSSDGTIVSVQNFLFHNLESATKLDLLRDTPVPEPITISFY